MIGAKTGLRVAPVTIPDDERPAALAECPGTVARLDEQVIEPASFVADLADQHRQRIMKIDFRDGLELSSSKPGQVDLVRLINPESGDPQDIRPAIVVLTAGEGNADLLRMCGLAEPAMQRRPLHMAVLRGKSLPLLNGHCVDGAATRVTITSTRDFADRMVWQVGGQVAEAGVSLPSKELALMVRGELASVLPGVDFKDVEWSTYKVDRAEPATKGRARPDDCAATRQGNTIAAWPTKLALVPELSHRIVHLIGERSAAGAAGTTSSLAHWPRPVVAIAPWECETQWFTDL
jgi:hypothetical protein